MHVTDRCVYCVVCMHVTDLMGKALPSPHDPGVLTDILNDLLRDLLLLLCQAALRTAHCCGAVFSSHKRLITTGLGYNGDVTAVQWTARA